MSTTIIEFSQRYTYSVDGKRDWIEMHFIDSPIQDSIWKKYIFRINGVIYMECTEEFNKIYNEILMWELLNR